MEETSLPSGLSLPPSLMLCNTPLSGRSLFSKEALPAYSTILTEKATHFYSHSLHETSSCATCVSFYDAPGFLRALRSFKGHKGYLHLLASVLSSSPEEQELFGRLDHQSIQLDSHPDLVLTVEFVCRWKGLSYDSFSEVLAKLVSNCHGSRDPPDNGLYLVLSMSQNHSCLPNCFFYLQGDTVTVRLLKDVPPLTELTIGYIDQLYLPTPLRQRLLAYRGFQCACARCASGEEVVRAFQCPQQECKGALSPKGHLYQCDECAHRLDYEDIALEDEEKVAAGQGEGNALHSRHYLVHQQLDSSLSSGALPCKDYQLIAQQVISNLRWLHGVPHHPLCIQLLDLVAQKYHHAGQPDQTRHWLELAHRECSMVYGQHAHWTAYQKQRLDNGLPPVDVQQDQQQQECSLY